MACHHCSGIFSLSLLKNKKQKTKKNKGWIYPSPIPSLHQKTVGMRISGDEYLLHLAKILVQTKNSTLGPN
jgi:hypothetical protein